MKFKLKYEIYILPILFFIALFNFHYFGFYENDFKFNKSIIQPNFKENEYEKIMSYHPYSIIYQYAKKFENKNNQIYLFLLKKDDKNLDYTSTYYLNQNNKSGIIKKSYINEFTVISNYFFYPKKVNALYTFSEKELNNMNLKNDDIILSDTEIIPYSTNKFTLKRITLDREGNPLVRINRAMEDIYYLYIVENVK